VLAKFVTQQLSAPSGIVGRWVLAPLWSRRNSVLSDVIFDCLTLHSHDRMLEAGLAADIYWGGSLPLRRGDS